MDEESVNMELQREEIEVLRSIFDESEFECETEPQAGRETHGQLRVRMELGAAGARLGAWHVRHLPAVAVRFVLPRGYPTRAAARVALGDAAAAWLPPAERALLRQLLRARAAAAAAADGAPALFALADAVRADALPLLLKPPPSDAAADAPPALVDALLPAAPLILAASDARDAAVFAASTVTCAICCDARLGASCLRFAPCRHAFCAACLRAFFSLCIREGDIRSVACPHEACKRASAKLTASAAAAADPPPRPITSVQLARILDDDALVRRYELLVEQAALLQKPNLTYCPRQMCNAPTLKDPDEEKLCVCPACKYAFCFFCNKSWHGNAAYCEIRHLESIAKEYSEASDSAKRVLELRYGKKTLEKVVREIEEDRLNRGWFEENAQKCPNCTCMVERTEGCCHMICKVCDVHFCYVCGDKLNASNPYAHFNTKGSSCYGKLFEGTNTADYDPFNDPEIEHEF